MCNPQFNIYRSVNLSIGHGERPVQRWSSAVRAQDGPALRHIHKLPYSFATAMDAAAFLADGSLFAVFRYPNFVVPERFRIHRQLRDLHEQRPRDAAPGMDSEGRERQ